jgi:hypothetical protein
MKRSETPKTVSNSGRLREIYSRVIIKRTNVLSELTVTTKSMKHDRVFDKMRAIYTRRSCLRCGH